VSISKGTPIGGEAGGFQDGLLNFGIGTEMEVEMETRTRSELVIEMTSAIPKLAWQW
jgi:hypothetical protein